MNNPLVFIVPGEPHGKGRPKFFRKGNFVGTYTPEKTANYENLIKVMFMQEANRMGGWMAAKGVPVHVSCTCIFEVPKSWSKKKQDGVKWVTRRPDIDNIAKAVLDGLNGVAWHDDAQVVKMDVFKQYGQEPCMLVTLIALTA